MSSGADQPENYFGERVAVRYDELNADTFDPSVVDPAVDFLARALLARVQERRECE